MAETKKTTTTRTRRKKEETPAEVKPVETASTGEKMFSEAEVKQMIAEAIKSVTENQGNTVKEVVLEETVKVLFMGKVSRDNTMRFGRFGAIYGNYGAIDVPKSSFGGEFMTSWVRNMLDERSLVVVEGLTDRERERYGVLYKPGEVLTEQEYTDLLDMDEETICKRYGEVCNHFRILIASEIENARFNGDKRVKRETVEHLNRISKEINARLYPIHDVRRMGDFAMTLREMGIMAN